MITTGLESINQFVFARAVAELAGEGPEVGRSGLYATFPEVPGKPELHYLVQPMKWIGGPRQSGEAQLVVIDKLREQPVAAFMWTEATSGLTREFVVDLGYGVSSDPKWNLFLGKLKEIAEQLGEPPKHFRQDVGEVLSIIHMLGVAA
jgi:hypothetical protein